MKIDKKSSSIIGWFIMVIVMVFYTSLAFKSNYYFGIFVMLAFICFSFYTLFSFKRIIITEDLTTLKWLWTNKVIWEFENSEIETIKATYFADVKYRSKKLFFKLKNGSNYKTNIQWTTLDEIAKIYFIKNKTTLFVKINGKFEKYKIPTYTNIPSNKP